MLTKAARFDGHDDEQFLEAVSRIIFRREIDPGAKESYLDRMRDGATREQVVGDMLDSDEFRDWPTPWYRDHEAREFAKENETFWRKREGWEEPEGGTPYLVVSFCSPDPVSAVRNGFIAKYLQAHYNCRLMAMVPAGEWLSGSLRLARSFGVDGVFLLDAEHPPERRGELSVLLGKDRIRENLLSLRFDGLPVGDLVYDSYLKAEGARTIDGIDGPLEWQYSCARSLYDSYVSLFDQCGGDVLATVQDGIEFLREGLLARMAHARGATVFSQHGRDGCVALRKIEPADDIGSFGRAIPWSRRLEERLGAKAAETGYEIARRCLGGEPGQDGVVPQDGHSPCAPEALRERLGLRPGRPTVLILSDLSSDAPHRYGERLFEDHHQWLLCTLEIAKELPDANWIVMPRRVEERSADRAAFPAVAEPYERGCAHIRVCPPDIQATDLVECADALVAEGGTAGLAAAALGKPCVQAGAGPYGGNGYPIEPRTATAYADALRALPRPEALSPEAVRRARLCAYLYFGLGRVPCAFLPPYGRTDGVPLPVPEQWAYMTERLRDTRVADDPLFRNLAIQLETGSPHLLALDGREPSEEGISRGRPGEAPRRRRALALSACPRVSVVTICRNRKETIRRCVESVLSQDYPNVEYIIQDGVSTDGTLEIIRGYDDPRIRLVSERDASASHAYFKGLKRCTGDLVTLCWSDEELLPGVVRWGVRQMQLRPDVGAIFGDVYPTDFEGKILPVGAGMKPWNPEAAFCWEMIPNSVGSFMRMDALRESGFFEFTDSFFEQGRSGPAETNCIMYDYFALVSIRRPVLLVPRFVGKFSVHVGQLSSTAEVLLEMIPTLIRSFEHLCEVPDAPEWVPRLRGRAHAGFRLGMINSLLSNAGDFEEGKRMLSEALRYEPDPLFLDRVILESCNFFLSRNRPHDAFDMVRCVLDAGHRRPALLRAYAAVAIDLGDVDAAAAAVEEGLAADPGNKELGLLQPHLLKDRKALRDLEEEMSKRSGASAASRLMTQLAGLGGARHRETLRRRLFPLRRNGSVEELFFMRHAVLKALERPGFLLRLRREDPDSARWMEELLESWLDVAVEAGAGELRDILVGLLVADGNAQADPAARLAARA